MRCNQCGKEIPESNYHPIIINKTQTALCGKHYSQYIKYGHFLDSTNRSIHDSNEYEITNEGVWIYTFNRKGSVSGKFLIDIDDLDRVIVKKWRFWRGRYYTGNRNVVTISRFIMNPDENEVVDHVNGNPADNRKCNLRITTQAKNLLNKNIQSNNESGIVGIWYDCNRGTWNAEIKMSGVKCYLGRHKEKSDAAFARYYAETRLFKEFRCDRNDKSLMKLVAASKNKEKIKTYVDKRLHQKFSI